jgi:hypothetical protein
MQRLLEKRTEKSGHNGTAECTFSLLSVPVDIVK